MSRSNDQEGSRFNWKPKRVPEQSASDVQGFAKHVEQIAELEDGIADPLLDDLIRFIKDYPGPQAAESSDCTQRFIDGIKTRIRKSTLYLPRPKTNQSHKQSETWWVARLGKEFFAMGLLLIVGLGLVSLTILWGIGWFRPVAVETDGDRLDVYNKFKKVLWNRVMSDQIKQADVDDLDGDDRGEILVALEGEYTEGGGRLVVFDSRGGILWERQMPQKSYLSDKGSGKQAVTLFETADLNLSGTKEIVILCRDSHGYTPSVAYLLTSDGTPFYEFWHPGHIYQLKIGAETRGSLPVIVIGGINNHLSERYPAPPEGHHARCLFLLSINNPLGQPDYWGSPRPNSPLLWYSLLLPRGPGINLIDFVDRDGDGISEISLWASTGYIHYLDFDGNVLEVRKADGDVKESEMRSIAMKDL